MDTPKSSPKSSPQQVQDQIDNATAGTDGTNEQQELNVKARAFLKLIPEVSPGFDPSVSTSALPFTASNSRILSFAMGEQFKLHMR